MDNIRQWCYHDRNFLAIHIIGTVLYVLLVWLLAYWLHSLPNIKGSLLASYGGILASAASAIIVGAATLNLYGKTRPAVNVIFITFISLLYGMIFTFPRTEIKPEVLRSNIDWIDKCRGILDTAQGSTAPAQGSTAPAQGGPLKLDEITLDLIKEEHKKAIEEIKQRTIIDDQWYNNKFILVGGLFAAFLAYSSPFAAKVSTDSIDRNTWPDLTTHIGRMFKTIVPSSVLGMACVVSLAIDMHIRSNGIVTRQIGLWIESYVECLLDYSEAYRGWESFLRMDNDPIISKALNEDIQGMHMDFIFSITTAHFYFTSIYLYILYMGCLFLFSSTSRCEKGEFKAVLFIFVLVHLTLTIFSFAANSFPSVLQVRIALWPGQWFSGETAGWILFAISLLVTGLSFMRICALDRICYFESHRSDGAVDDTDLARPNRTG